MSFVLNGVTDQKISEATKEAVLRAARELEYRPDRAARALALGTSSTLIAVIPQSQLGEGALMLLSALTAELGHRGLSLAVWFESDDHPALGSLVHELKPAGVFPLFGSLPDWIGAQHLHGSPTVRSLNLPPSQLDIGASLQVSYLHGKGHQRIGYVGTSEPVMATPDRHRHDTVAEEAKNLGMGAAIFVSIDAEGTDAAAALSKLRQESVTAVCCYNDRIAFIMIDALRQAGLRCPADMAVIGYDAIPLSAWASPPLTSIAWDPAETAVAFADLLLHSLHLSTPTAVQAAKPPLMHVIERESA